MKYKEDQKASEKLKILWKKDKRKGVEGSEERIKYNNRGRNKNRVEMCLILILFLRLAIVIVLYNPP